MSLTLWLFVRIFNTLTGMRSAAFSKLFKASGNLFDKFIKVSHFLRKTRFVVTFFGGTNKRIHLLRSEFAYILLASFVIIKACLRSFARKRHVATLLELFSLCGTCIMRFHDGVVVRFSLPVALLVILVFLRAGSLLFVMVIKTRTIGVTRDAFSRFCRPCGHVFAVVHLGVLKRFAVVAHSLDVVWYGHIKRTKRSSLR